MVPKMVCKSRNILSTFWTQFEEVGLLYFFLHSGISNFSGPSAAAIYVTTAAAAAPVSQCIKHYCKASLESIETISRAQQWNTQKNLAQEGYISMNKTQKISTVLSR